MPDSSHKFVCQTDNFWELNCLDCFFMAAKKLHLVCITDLRHFKEPCDYVQKHKDIYQYLYRRLFGKHFIENVK